MIRPWICPDCATGFHVGVTITPAPNGHVYVKFEDGDVRAHLDMHEQCRCEWLPVHIASQEAPVTAHREPDGSCPVHKDDDWKRDLAVRRLVAGLDLPPELISGTPPPEEKK